ncbi:hypothetical protein Csa_000769 [Cucumis sativus]|uniref:Uncharacterized protein n=1 Tax=Cucumis sativus TaxID=3659 RepID=A0A0A0LB15_CUCSA|nr:hypothetical protein Csa_000769 [Cucumis sativus]
MGQLFGLPRCGTILARKYDGLVGPIWENTCLNLGNTKPSETDITPAVCFSMLRVRKFKKY